MEIKVRDTNGDWRLKVVKPIKWTSRTLGCVIQFRGRSGDGREWWVAPSVGGTPERGPIGTYFVAQHKKYGEEYVTGFATTQEAMAYCQGKFADLILSCLE